MAVQPGEFFSTITANIESNDALRVPQRDGHAAIRDFYQTGNPNREIGVVLPVGCGKSGLITLVPFAVRARRLLAITPYVLLAGRKRSENGVSYPPGSRFRIRSRSDRIGFLAKCSFQSLGVS
jgi:hypothetical protein